MSRSNILEYNGVQLRDCQTLKHSEEPVFGSDGVSLVGMRYHLRVLGYFSGSTSNFWPQMNPTMATAATADNMYLNPGAGQHYHYLNQFLNTPRKTLRYYVEALPFNSPDTQLPNLKYPFYLHYVEPAGEINLDTPTYITPVMDIEGGPKPVALEVTHMASNAVWRVEFEVTWVQTAHCPDFVSGTSLDPDAYCQDQFTDGKLTPDEYTDTQKQFGVQNHTWTCLEQIDTNFYTTRTYRGALRIASPEVNVMDFRVLCNPPLIPGMRRESIDYQQSEDKMTLSYTIVDKEVFVTPPKDFTGLQINHSESAVEFGNLSNVRLEVKLQGNRQASRQSMMQYALAIVDYKLHINQQAAGINNQFQLLFDQLEVSTSEGTHQDNSITVLFQGKKTHNQNMALGNNFVGQAKWFGFLTDRFFQRLTDAAFTTIPGGAAPYSNDLMKGNRLIEPGVYDTPDVAGGISTVTAYHAALSEACAVDFSWTALADDATADRTKRAAIQLLLEAGIPITPTVTATVTDSLSIMVPEATLSPSHKSFTYTCYYITTNYIQNALSVMLPSSETTSSSTSLNLASSIFCRLGPAQWQKIVNIVAERYGTKPRIPEAKDLPTEAGQTGYKGVSSPTAQAKLLEATTTPSAPQWSADMSGLIYRIEAMYRYGIDIPPKYMRFGVPDTHAAALTPGATSLSEVYKAQFSDVQIPSLGDGNATQNAWQIND